MCELIKKYIKKFEQSYIKKGEDDCWLWKTSPKTLRFYLKYSSKKTFVSAKRFAYLAYVGQLDEKQLIFSKCENYLCVNPNHLFVETVKNMSKNTWSKLSSRRSKISKAKTGIKIMFPNRNTAIGTRHGMAKLDPDRVRLIRSLVKKGESKKVVAETFGCSERNIRAIVNFEIWKHVKN
ncbi:MAG: hypothetical protein HOJ35_00295 [Bdellovibrionales bacterium]|jgi:hypothetical protein|nr:hypothetical protein [Bdellovibrionales bacterium]